MLQRETGADDGFSLVEIVIAMLILGIIAMALIPPLWQGIRFSSEQSTVATATRQLNALIEDARATPTCGTLNAAAAIQSFNDGRGASFTTAAQAGYACTSDTLVFIRLTATQGSKELASVTAEIFAGTP